MTELTVMRDIKRSLIKAELDAYLSTGSTESLHGVRDACTDLEVIEARLEERAGRSEPVPPVRYATADGSPGDVVYQLPPNRTYTCAGCWKQIDWRQDHACPGMAGRTG